ncbi:hypothetical protein [Curvivirga sp.]|uniref:hypothetical protein n=1 Tax=Curvivirga sp. TaxID=2856848 RepID=UPI003B5BE47D
MGALIIASIVLLGLISTNANAHEKSMNAFYGSDVSVQVEIDHHAENHEITKNHSTNHDMHDLECMTFQCHALALFDFNILQDASNDKEEYVKFFQMLVDADLSNLNRPPRHV